MPGKNNPEEKALVLALLKSAKVKGEPLSWNLLESGSMIIVLVTGPKLVFAPAQVKAAPLDKDLDKKRPSKSQRRGYKDPDLESRLALSPPKSDPPDGEPLTHDR